MKYAEKAIAIAAVAARAARIGERDRAYALLSTLAAAREQVVYPTPDTAVTHHALAALAYFRLGENDKFCEEERWAEEQMEAVDASQSAKNLPATCIAMVKRESESLEAAEKALDGRFYSKFRDDQVIDILYELYAIGDLSFAQLLLKTTAYGGDDIWDTTLEALVRHERLGAIHDWLSVIRPWSPFIPMERFADGLLAQNKSQEVRDLAHTLIHSEEQQSKRFPWLPMLAKCDASAAEDFMRSLKPDEVFEGMKAAHASQTLTHLFRAYSILGWAEMFEPNSEWTDHRLVTIDKLIIALTDATDRETSDMILMAIENDQEDLLPLQLVKMAVAHKGSDRSSYVDSALALAKTFKRRDWISTLDSIVNHSVYQSGSLNMAWKACCALPKRERNGAMQKIAIACATRGHFSAAIQVLDQLPMEGDQPRPFNARVALQAYLSRPVWDA